MNKTTPQQMMKSIYELERTEGRRCTLLGIGPMSKPVIEASFELAKQKDFPLMFIASRNQVDAYKLGGGYVCNWDQKAFAKSIAELAESTGFDGIYYLCRDHGGPWQRDNEKNAKLPEDEAMEIAKLSYVEDIVSGFGILHIDPTKDPHIKGVVPMELVINRTVQLIEHIEQERIKRSLPEVAYEVGTEETNGGLTSRSAYGDFIELLSRSLSSKNLPMPVFIVGQTGTLTRLTENKGNFDAGTAMLLSEKAREYGIGLKEHNADYLSDFVLYCHPMLGITAANVAPEFGVAETEAYLMLANLEKDAFKKGILKSHSRFVEALSSCSVECERWRKWMTGSATGMSIEEVKRDKNLVDLVTRVSGHYNFENEGVRCEKEILFSNIKKIGLRPEKVVKNRLIKTIGRYVDCFNLEGLTSKILNTTGADF